MKPERPLELSMHEECNVCPLRKLYENKAKHVVRCVYHDSCAFMKSKILKDDELIFAEYREIINKYKTALNDARHKLASINDDISKHNS